MIGGEAPRQESSGTDAGSDAGPETLDVAIDLRPGGHTATEALHGRLAVVTGGSGRLGRAIALRLAHAGARVCVIGRDLARLRATTDEAGRDAPMLYLQCDLGSAREIEGLGEFIERFDRPVDLLVHAAGVMVPGSVADGDAADVDEQYLVNVRGPMLVCQTFLPQLRQGHGEVVFVRPAAGPSVSTLVRVTSAGAAALAEGLAIEEAPHGVRVSSVVVDVADPPLPEADVAEAVVGLVQLGASPGRLAGFEIHLRAATAATEAIS